MGDRGSGAREALWEAFKRLFPSAALLVSPQAGLAASAAVFAAWLLARRRRSRGRGRPEEELARLLEEKRSLEARVRLLEEALSGAGEHERRGLEEALELARRRLYEVSEEIELLQLELAALEYLERSGGQELVEKVRRIIGDIERGRRFEDRQLEAMRMLEERWARRELEASVLKTLLGLRG